MQLLFGYDEQLAKWVASRLPDMRAEFGPCRAIGVAEGTRDDARFYAAVVYHNFIEQAANHKTCEVSIAALSPRWALRGIIRALLSVPFEQYGVFKLYSIMSKENERAVRFNQGIGFKQEAVLRHHFGKGRHAVVTSMLANEFRKLYGDGKVLTGRRDPKVVKFPTGQELQISA